MVVSTRTWIVSAALAVATVAMAAACESFDEGAKPAEDAGTAPPDGAVDSMLDGDPIEPVDGGADAAPAPIVIEIPISTSQWISPNKATWKVDDAGLRITNFDPATANHPIVYPNPQPAIPADDYTVRITVHAVADGEFGVLARGTAGDEVVAFGSKYGAEHTPFVGETKPPAWKLVKSASAPAYAFTAGARYEMLLKVSGAQVAAKLWPSTSPEPAEPQLLYVATRDAGRGVGFYTFGVAQAVLEKMTVTVP